MAWVFLIIAAQFLNAIVTLVDKFLVTSPLIGRPVVYAFYIGAMSGVAVLLLPFDVVSPLTADVAWLSLVAGVSYVFSILFLYKALKLSDASDVAPALGAVSAVATLGFSAVFLGGSLAGNFLYGFILLVVGTFITSYFHLTKKATLFLIVAGILFGFSTIFLKELFNHTAFWNGFFWSRLANVAGVLLLLLLPMNARAIWSNLKTSSIGTKITVLANKIIAGFAFLMILYAIKLGDVSIINALTGTQFAFLLLLTVLFTPTPERGKVPGTLDEKRPRLVWGFTKKYPQYLYETVHRHALARKAVATAVIAIGLAFLFL